MQETNFILYPFGEIGLTVKEILNVRYGIQESYIIDNGVSKYNKKIFSEIKLRELDLKKYVIIVTSEVYSNEICEKLDALDGCRYIRIFDKEEIKVDIPKGTTPSDAILKNPLRGNVGKYCSFAKGANLVANHPINFVTTSPILYDGFRGRKNDLISTYHIGVDERKYKTEDFNAQVNIGNDVWLGENVLIQNGVTIGDGCIIGSGAVVTKDIPDYAIAVGVPAKVIRYRFEGEEIEKLKKIAWWDWPTEKIKENYEDFFDVKEFINKHYR